VVAFAGSGKTTALRLLALADRTPALYLAYNKSTQLAAQAHFPAHVACRTMHSLAYRAMRMFEQQHRLERKLTGGEVAELLAIPALDGLRPSFWGHCVVLTVRSFTHDTAREISAQHLPPLPQELSRRPRTMHTSYNKSVSTHTHILTNTHKWLSSFTGSI
jgi:hypothetical protein